MWSLRIRGLFHRFLERAKIARAYARCAIADSRYCTVTVKDRVGREILVIGLMPRMLWLKGPVTINGGIHYSAPLSHRFYTKKGLEHAYLRSTNETDRELDEGFGR